MKKSLAGFLAVVLFLSIQAKADEGMWLPSLIGKLNIDKMHSMGLKLSAEQIYSINNSSLKDAVVALDHGSCTAEIVSAEGLLLTNHHCGFSEIQGHSSVEHDYLKDGFWARNHDQELPNPGKSVTFLVRMEDVTDRVLKGISDTMSLASRQEKMMTAMTAIEKEAKGNGSYETQVRPLFEANTFYLFVTETFKDVRLVGAPPQSIGKFGGEADNWMWPRHTGDFSMFRIYCAPDGKPAEYAKENVPYHPKHYLPVSLAGEKMNDFTMIMGYPGRTNRYLTSFGLKYTMDVVNKIRIKVRAAKLELIGAYMAKGEKNRIQYASKFAISSNYYKYSIGQNMGLSALNVLDKKLAVERDFTKWVNQNPARKAKYGDALSNIAKSYQSVDEKIASEYAREALFGGPEIYRFALGASSLFDELKGNDKDKIKAASDRFKASFAEFYKDYDAETDQKITAALTKMYAENVADKYHPSFIEEVPKKYKGNYDAFAKHLFKKSIFPDQQKLEAFLKKPSKKVLDKDPVFVAMRSILVAMGTIGKDLLKSTADLENGKKLFVAGLNEMNKDKTIYPDANSTMRLTYGKVGDYNPRDGVHYNYFTTLKGYAEKGIAGDADFDFPKHLIDLYHAADYGRYADKDGTLHTCFTTNNDITGGNSGSPVMNANGELIGLAFDGNWEAMSGDIAYEPDLQKCICVDIRFVLWIIDKFAGAKHLVDEMTIAG
ncbi:MAG: S46 family peptidase [Bacteroidetes bacterium]|nr:S46 family peptidase [Bacteroidota bacterium]